MSDKLAESVQYLKSVGPKRAESFNQIGIATIKDLLYYFPSRYLDRSTILNTVKVVQHVINGYEGEVTIVGEVVEKEVIRYSRKQLLKVRLKDKTGNFECVWFQGLKYFKDIFNKGEFYAISAKPVITRYGNLQFTHPAFDRLADNESHDFLNTGKIIPFYRVPKELRSTNIGDSSLRRIIRNIIEEYIEDITETLPEYLITSNSLLTLKTALKNIHDPQDNQSLEKAWARFKYEELFYIECLVAMKKYNLKNKISGHAFETPKELINNFLKSLSFELTKAQLNVLSEIRNDMESSKPMNRLLQGDVGSGKTIVALISILIPVSNNYQAVLMAPTEILAMQHYNKISELLKEFPVNITILIGSQRKSDREKILESIKTNEANIIIGTHALLESDVDFKKIGLVVIDEQHRFGVAQRSTLISKGYQPDVLVMTATPIPRTLTMTVYGDLDISTIDQMPQNRIPVKTYLRGERKLPDIYKFVIDKHKEGYQSFIVYPLVEDSEKIELKAAETFYEELKSTYLKELNVGLVHGKMKWKDKDEMMIKFANKKYDVIIATTVIEVGIDIPDANLIIINDAHRFGLSQLHQLRGRVGRSDKQAYCILVTHDNLAVRSDQFNYDYEYLSLAQIDKNKSIIRLNSMVKNTSGFKLSEIDLKLRGPGDILGTKQSGFPELKYADIINDANILTTAKENAFKIIEADPLFDRPEHNIIKKTLQETYSNRLYYSNIG
ncbi:ATP-dependent DNA helicase RecG [Bacteroidota bacterium]